MLYFYARLTARKSNVEAPTTRENYKGKLAEARRYLGQIANRTSIAEARKIANKALKVTS